MNGKKRTKIPCKFNSRFIFSDTLIRIIRIVQDAKKLENIIMSTDLPYIFSEDNTPIKFIYNINKTPANNFYTNIKWVLFNETIKTPINLSFTFSENTLENTVLAILEISFTKRELIPLKYTDKIINMVPRVSVDIISNLDKMLQDDKNDIYHYQSRIVNYSREKIMDIIINLQQILVEKGIISSFSLDNEEGLKEGSIITLNLIEGEKKIKLKITKLKTNPDNKKWTIEYLPLKDLPKEQILQLRLIKLENDKTLICVINKFWEHIESDLADEITLKNKQACDFIEEELKLRYNSK